MTAAIPRHDSSLLTQIRAFSAYSNLCQVEENEDIDETLLDYWQLEPDEVSYELEVEIQKDAAHQGGLAFRIIGSRTSGIFISYVDRTSQQASVLMEGDLIKVCNGKEIKGLTCNQAASILRHALSHGDILRLQITRKSCGVLLMEKRRSLVRISQEQECSFNASSSGELRWASSSKMCQSTSCPDYPSITIYQ
ncbi:hypothetical protein KIN20_005513 [Parelaphostrongylus tenuis]|uniref:PDZ domain-containing protein n=1 Tax=Parelaphostrongylus tenuis TaxID=148309 RepID=A0AAD5QK60_PARTN|nr:hypothetical protein KIN20_005513 [Parelaphostrongylus tenuis]